MRFRPSTCLVPLFAALLSLQCSAPYGSASAGSSAAEQAASPSVAPGAGNLSIGSGAASEPVAQAFADAAEAIEAIIAIPDPERTFDNTPGAVDDLVARLFMEVRWTGFMSSVHPDLSVRTRGEEVSQELSNWFTELYLNEGLYAGLSAYAATEPKLQGERERLLSEMLRDFRRAGMELSDEQRAELKEFEFELTELEKDFGKNIRDDEGFVALTAEELDGAPQDWLDSLPRSRGLYIVDMKGSVIRPIFRSCHDPRTRQRVSLAYGRRAGRKNVAVLEKIIELRHKKARMLGYDSTAAYETEIRMAKDPSTVMGFFEELRPKLRRKALVDLEEFTAAKREFLGDPGAEFDPWDYSFYRNYLLETRYAVDSEKVQEYFPLQRVYDGLFQITQQLFGLEYRDVTADAAGTGRELWHEDVRLYEVWDRETKRMLGEFYTDLHPRPNKYSHAAQFPLVLRKRWSDGSLTTPVVALVCNFTKPTEEKPALLTHGEVETFFHEFGHCLHSILTEANYANFSGTNVARDFVEAPSQMLENWVWNRDVLATFAGHYETGEPLPDELLDGMIAARNLASGMDYEYQVYLGMMDMRFHTDPDGLVDSTAVAFDTARECRLLDPVEETFGHGSFGHMSGYQAGYYGYLWSLVYAQDMFGRFKQHGLLDPAAGKYYREKILSKGGTVDALDLVTDYLERDPNSDAFLEHLGLTANPVD